MSLNYEPLLSVSPINTFIEKGKNKLAYKKKTSRQSNPLPFKRKNKTSVDFILKFFIIQHNKIVNRSREAI